MSSNKILIVEDEIKLARFIELELKYEGYEVEVAHDGRTGLNMYYENKHDLILLDLMLPEMNGLEVCRRIRKDSNVPIILLTAKGEVMDKVTGLDNGADDYVTKPFAIEEVLARMRVALKRNRAESTVLSFKGLTMDIAKHLVKYGDDEIELTKKEFDLLLYLMQNKNIVITRDQIINAVWGYDYIGETNVVDVYVRYLRTKLDDRYNEKIIHTVRGVGYSIKEEQ